MSNIKVLFAEDEITLATIVMESLATKSIAVTLASDGQEAYERFKSEVFDVLVLDIMMPEMDGLTLLKNVRKMNQHIPVILLTAKSQPADVVLGFKTGATDYLKKPFSMEELIVRIEAVLGRTQVKNNKENIRIGTYQFDFVKQTLTHPNESYSLTHMEAQILQLLAQNKNEVVSKDIILTKIWGNNSFFNGRSLDVFVSKIRKKLSHDSAVKILNSRGYGYKLVY